MTGSSAIAASGKRVSTGWTATCSHCRPRKRGRRSVDARNSGGFSLSLPTDREILLTRSFKAPRTLVFEAWTRPEHVRQWYGCGSMALVVCEIDLRVGGSYCYVMRGPDGVNHGMEGTYREIAPPERLVYTERYVTQGFESNEALVTVTL